MYRAWGCGTYGELFGPEVCMWHLVQSAWSLLQEENPSFPRLRHMPLDQAHAGIGTGPYTRLPSSLTDDNEDHTEELNA